MSALTVAIVDRELRRRHRHGDLRRLPVGAVPQPAAHGDAVRAADRARLDGAHAVFLGHGLCRAGARLAAVLRRHCVLTALPALLLIAVAAEARTFPRPRRRPQRRLKTPRLSLVGVAFDLVGGVGLQLAVVLDADALQQVELRLDEVDVALLVLQRSSNRSIDT